MEFEFEFERGPVVEVVVVVVVVELSIWSSNSASLNSSSSSSSSSSGGVHYAPGRTNWQLDVLVSFTWMLPLPSVWSKSLYTGLNPCKLRKGLILSIVILYAVLCQFVIEKILEIHPSDSKLTESQVSGLGAFPLCRTFFEPLKPWTEKNCDKTDTKDNRIDRFYSKKEDRLLNYIQFRFNRFRKRHSQNLKTNHSTCLASYWKSHVSVSA